MTPEQLADQTIGFYIMGLVTGAVVVIMVCSGWRSGVRSKLWRASWALDAALNVRGHDDYLFWREEVAAFLKSNRRIYKPTRESPLEPSAQPEDSPS